MSKFNKEESHNAVAMLFDSCGIEAKFKSRSDLRYVIVKDKEEGRLAAMLSSAGHLSASFNEHQKSAIACVAIAKNEEEAIAMSLGLIQIKAQGIAVCGGCLEKAIAICKENLAVLEDIQEATKAYSK